MASSLDGIHATQQIVSEEMAEVQKPCEMHVAYTIDVQGDGARQFEDQVLVSMFSMRESMASDDIIKCHILYGHITAELMQKLLKLENGNFKVEFVKIKQNDLDYMQSLSKYPAGSSVRNWNGIVFARLWIPLALPTVDKCIYTDADTLIRKSIKPLWETDLEGNLLGCPKGTVPEYGFYSGLMLMDCKAMRAEKDLYLELSKHLGQYAKTYYLPDQTTVNRFFVGRIKEVNMTWCIPPRPGKGDFRALNNAAIWHFYEGGKPRRLDTDEFGYACLNWQGVLMAAEKAIGS